MKFWKKKRPPTVSSEDEELLHAKERLEEQRLRLRALETELHIIHRDDRHGGVERRSVPRTSS